MTEPGSPAPAKNPNALKFRLILVAFSSLLAAGLAYAIWGGGQRGFTVVVDSGIEDAPAWRGSNAYVIDPVVGLRPRRGLTTKHTISALQPIELVELTKRRCSAGFHRLDDLPAELTGPRVLFVGDSHLDGVVDTARNLTTLLEKELRAEGIDCWMLNSGCGGYSIWQQYLRASVLVPKYRPKVIVPTLFLGNDFFELEDRSRPHLSDEMEELQAIEGEGEPEIPGAFEALRLELFESLYGQGFRQADWFHHKPDRWPVVKGKAAHAIEAFERLAKEHDAELLWVLIPPADLVFASKLGRLSERARAVLDGGVQERIHGEFVEMLSGRGATVIDLLKPFRATDDLALYATDFHIFFKGHRMIADLLLPSMRDRLKSD